MSAKNPWESESMTPEQKEGPESRVFFIRHSKATYTAFTEKLASEEPETPIDIPNQPSDLPEAGIELADKSAREFFARFDPTKDVFYLVSSSQMRALETAKIYADVAEELGFEIVRSNPEKHEQLTHAKREFAQQVGDGKVRILENLSLHDKNQVQAAAFNPRSNTPAINWEKVDPETKEKFDEAHAIVLTDDKGAWGANYQAHAQAVKTIFPDLRTPKELHHTQYRNLTHLADFARKRAHGEKRVNVVAFGHENYMGIALEHDTREHSIGNTEVVELDETGTLKRF